MRYCRNNFPGKTPFSLNLISYTVRWGVISAEPVWSQYIAQILSPDFVKRNTPWLGHLWNRLCGVIYRLPPLGTHYAHIICIFHLPPTTLCHVNVCCCWSSLHSSAMKGHVLASSNHSGWDISTFCSPTSAWIHLLGGGQVKSRFNRFSKQNN